MARPSERVPASFAEGSEILKARITRTNPALPVPWQWAQACGAVARAPDGWYWMAATPRSAARIRRDGHKSMGSEVIVWYPPQSLGFEILNNTEPEGEFRPIHGPDDMVIGIMAPVMRSPLAHARGT